MTRRATRAPRSATPAGPTALRADAEAAGVDLYVHAPYIVNVATTNNRIRIPSRKLLQQHMDAAASIGAKGLIVHGGHVNKDDDPAKGFDNWRKAIEATDIKIPLLIENTAGGDNAMARHLDRIAGVWDAISRAEGFEDVGFCLDTCHAWAGGIELPTAVEKVRSITGRIDLLHANDSRDAFDSGADRHANFGNGQLDEDDFAGVVRDAGDAGHLRDPRWRRRAPGGLRVAARARRLSLGRPLTRRAMLAATAAAALLAGCGAGPGAARRRRRRAGRASGSGTATSPTSSPTCGCPTGDPAATLVLLHGGYWQPGYGLDLMEPLAERFTELGYATWNVEYRHTGDGGTPTPSATSPRPSTGSAEVARRRDWTARSSSSGTRPADTSRPGPPPAARDTPGGAPQVDLRGAISLSGVLDLTRAATDPRSLAPVIAFLGGTPDRRARAPTPSPTPPCSCRPRARSGPSTPPTTRWSRPSRAPATSRRTVPPAARREQ